MSKKIEILYKTKKFKKNAYVGINTSFGALQIALMRGE